MQTIVTDAGEELVILSRRDYDVLLARLGDEDAEERMTALIVDESNRRIASGEDVVLPASFSDGIMRGEAPVRTARSAAGLSVGALAEKAALPEADLDELDRGARPPTQMEAKRIATALDIDVRWIDD